MVWGCIALLYVAALLWSVFRHSVSSPSQIICLDFGDATELVEPTIRQLAKEVERHSIYDLSVYLQANDEEARSIAVRLGEQVPMNLYLGNHPACEVIEMCVVPRDITMNIEGPQLLS